MSGIRLALGVVLVLLAPTAGCSTVWDAFNRAPLEADVAEVLGRGLEETPELECRMIGTTRSGVCVFPVDSDTVLTLAGRLGLDAGMVDPDDPTAALPAGADAASGCLSPEVVGQAASLPVYWAAGRPAILRLQDSGQFEYLILVHDGEAGEACVQVSYAYG